ncbi:MAG: sulfatase-like hydrolase/transferase, partial [bacterium]|nr:sulfatase-like hydrolase/transferase [bacterium]
MLPELVPPHRSRGVSRAPGALTARRWLAVGTAWFAAVGCGPQPPPAGPAVERLIGDSFSEAGITWDYVHFDEQVIDFTSAAELESIRVGGARHRLRPDGLLVSPLSNDPILAFGDHEMPYNFIRIAMASSASGNLQVFWSAGGSPFAPERRKTIPVRASEQPATYDVDLSHDLDPSASGHRFRIDPIDQQAEVRIRTITFSRAVPTPAGSKAVRAGKVKIGHEVREALMLRAGAGIERRIRGGEGAKLLFGLARSRGNQVPVRFRITLGGTELFDERLGIAGEVAWRDREVDLAACPRAGCAVTLEVSPAAASAVRPAVFVSNPVVVGGGERRLPHVVLISLDTLGARHLRSFGGPAGSSPHLDAFARQAVVFENGFANSSATHTSHGSLLTGSAPFSTAYYWLDGAVDGEVTLADALRR